MPVAVGVPVGVTVLVLVIVAVAVAVPIKTGVKVPVGVTVGIAAPREAVDTATGVTVGAGKSVGVGVRAANKAWVTSVARGPRTLAMGVACAAAWEGAQNKNPPKKYPRAKILGFKTNRFKNSLRYLSSATTAAPICWHETVFSLPVARSDVRSPLSSTFSTADSMASDSF